MKVIWPKDANRILFHPNIKTIDSIPFNQVWPLFLLSVLIFYILIASDFYFCDFVIDTIVFYFEKLEEIVLAALDFCDFASLDKMLRDRHLGFFSVTVECLYCYDSSLYLENHHSDDFRGFVIF